MVFDIKVEDFRCKARLVAGGHMTEALTTIMYARVVSRETVRIAVMIAALNDLEVKLGNILNAYVQALVTEQVWTTLGPEFGKDTRRTAVIARALYGLSQQEQFLEATLPDAWNPWVIGLVRLTWIYDLNQKKDQLME